MVIPTQFDHTLDTFKVAIQQVMTDLLLANGRRKT